MIKIDFRHIALFDTDGDGATVLFPETGHKLTIKREEGGKERAFSGVTWIEGRTASGKPVPQRGTKFEENGSVPSLGLALGGIFAKKVLDADELVNAKVASASLRLVGGALFAQNAILPSGYPVHYDDKWEVGFIRSTKLTNHVIYELPVNKGETYWIVNADGHREELEDGTTLFIANEDTAAAQTMTIDAGEAYTFELDDFLSLYTFLEGKPAGKLPKLKGTALKTFSGTPNRPLCPVGQP